MSAGPGIAAPHCSRGCAFGDFDNDGDIDVLIVNLNEPPSLLRNDVDRRRPLAESEAGRREIEPQRDRRARDRPLRRQSAGAGSARPVELLFRERFAAAFRAGRSRRRADLTIRWPNGNTETVNQVAVRPTRAHPGRVGHREEGEVGDGMTRPWAAYDESW